ncbi:MAG: mechanosensitive ion channel family protein, partial [Cyclobacteriaceae bacterium]|nr:mechanosensitive ion channel family protein [Cyclobacteriaceae bacterium]
MSRNLLFFFFVVSFFQGSTQDPVTNKLASPYHSIYTHLYYLQAEHYDERLAASPFRGQNVSQERALQAAIQLKQLLDGSGIFVDMELLPREVDYIDASLEKKRFVLTSDFPSIYLEKSGNKWVYPLESVKAIEKAHQTLFRLGTDKLLDLLPRLGTREVMGLHMYQYIGILFLAFLSALVHKVFSFLFNRLFLSVVKKAGYETLAEGYLIPIARPTSLFVVLALLVIYVPVLQ